MEPGIGLAIIVIAVGLFALAKLRRRPKRRRASQRPSRPRGTTEDRKATSRSTTNTPNTPSPSGSADPGAWAGYYKRRLWLVTRAEKQFEQLLRTALDELGLHDWRVVVQVASSALVERRGSGRGFMPPWRLDYVVVDAQWSIQGVIELNDGSHARDERRDRDLKLTAGLKRLGIPLLFVENQDRSVLRDWLNGLVRERERRLSRRT